MKKVFYVNYDNDMEEFNAVYTTRELAVEGIKSTIKACEREWENVSKVWFKNSARNAIESANIYLQEDDWEEKVHVNIIELPFVSCKKK